jgi:hypothetical protein
MAPFENISKRRQKYIDIIKKEPSLQEMVDLYNSGWSTPDLVKKFKMCQWSVDYRLRLLGVRIRTRPEARSTERVYQKRDEPLKYKFTKIQTKDIVDRYKKGYGMFFLSKKYKVDQQVIQRILVEQNIKTRTKQEADKQPIKIMLIAKAILKRFNGKHAMKDKKVVALRKKNSLKKYGCEYPMQYPAIQQKNQLSALSLKRVEIKGKTFFYQGYELKALTRLLEEGYRVDDIVTAKGEVPKIIYFYKGKQHLYFPDIFIPKENRIIEVKSQWTYNRDLKRNKAKEKAAKVAGYKFEFMILRNKD